MLSPSPFFTHALEPRTSEWFPAPWLRILPEVERKRKRKRRKICFSHSASKTTPRSEESEPRVRRVKSNSNSKHGIERIIDDYLPFAGGAVLGYAKSRDNSIGKIGMTLGFMSAALVPA